MEKYPTLFDGKLKVYKGQLIHLELKENAVPYRTRPYPIPHSHMDVFKQELDRLVNIGVLERCGRQEWIAGTFIIPKKDASVRWISDFRGLNRALKRAVYHLPRIGDILKRRQNYKYVTKLDISMQYYTFELDEESSNLCTIATPFGVYRYKRLPMGISCSPDISQEIMETVLRGIDGVEVYLDDCTLFSNNWQEHLELVNKVLSRLQDAGFTINPSKCEYSRKLNSAQRNYSTIEKELLSIVETLKEFRTMLLGARLRVYTDHKNLTHSLSAFATQRVLRWRLLMEEYGCTFHYKTGATNFLADALSRIPTSRTDRHKYTTTIRKTKEGRRDSNLHAVAFNDNKNSANSDDSAQAKGLSSKRRRARWPSVENDDAAVMSDDSAETLKAKAMPPKAMVPSKRTMPPCRAKMTSKQKQNKAMKSLSLKMRKQMKQKQNEKTWPNKTTTNKTTHNEKKNI